MKRLEQLNKIKDYEKQLKEKCKMHKQTQFGYSVARDPIKTDMAKNIVLDTLPNIAQPNYLRRVDDPIMYSIELAQKRKINNYVLRNPHIFLKRHEHSRHGKTTRDHDADTAQNSMVELINRLTPDEGQQDPYEQEMSGLTESQKISRELYDQGWRVIHQSGLLYGETILYVNPDLGVEASTNKPTQDTRRSRPDDIYVEYTDRENKYYMNKSTREFFRKLPAGVEEQNIERQNIELPETQVFNSFFKPRINQRIRGENVLPDVAIRRALINQIGSINTYNLRRYFEAITGQDRTYLLNTANIDTLNRRELIKQYKSIVNVLSEHQTEVVQTGFQILGTLNNQWTNRTKYNYDLVTTNEIDEIIEPQPAKDKPAQQVEDPDVITPSRQPTETAETGQVEDPNGRELQETTSSFTQQIIDLQDKLKEQLIQDITPQERAQIMEQYNQQLNEIRQLQQEANEPIDETLNNNVP